MNNPKHSLRVVAGATLALCSALVQAAPTQAELDSIVLYGSTTIAKDSTSAWGVWEQIDPPASGPSLPRIDMAPKAELYRPLAQVSVAGPATTVVVDGICQGGSICGFGAFSSGSVFLLDRMNKLAVSDEGAVNIEQPFFQDLFPYSLTAQEAALPAETVLERTQALAPTSYPSGLRILSKALDDGQFLVPDSDVLRHQTDGRYERDDGNYDVQRLADVMDYVPEDLPATWYDGTLWKYIAPQGESSGGEKRQNFYGVAGIVTPDVDMSALRNSGAMADYAGYDGSFGLAYAPTPNVVMRVDFGKSRFTATFNGGADGEELLVGNAKGGTLVAGRVGFTATDGVISGANFKSTTLSATDASSISGSVTGTFFGASAAAAGGVANVVKTRTDGRYTNGRFVSPFLLIKDMSPNKVRPRFSGG